MTKTDLTRSDVEQLWLQMIEDAHPTDAKLLRAWLPELVDRSMQDIGSINAEVDRRIRSEQGRGSAS